MKAFFGQLLDVLVPEPQDNEPKAGREWHFNEESGYDQRRAAIRRLEFEDARQRLLDPEHPNHSPNPGTYAIAQEAGERELG